MSLSHGTAEPTLPLPQLPQKNNVEASSEPICCCGWAARLRWDWLISASAAGNPHFILEVKQITAAAGARRKKKIKIKRANISYSGATSKMSRNSGMMVKLIFEALISDSPLALSGFTPCSCDSRADPFQTQPLRSIAKERFLFITVQHIQGPSHPHCKQIPSTQHHRPMGCNGSSQFTAQDAVED